MSQSIPQGPIRQSYHILIVDDSARLRYALADLIVAACIHTGKSYRVFHCDKDGRYTQGTESLGASTAQVQSNPANPPRLDEFVIYTAPSPRHALFVVNSPLFTQLTIISDVMMPSDTEVGLVGMLDAIARRNLSVNLVYASSDAQNRFVVGKLVDAGKAYFVVKADKVWEELAYALVNRTESFQFKKITPGDFAGIQGASNYALGATPAGFGSDYQDAPSPRPVAQAPVRAAAPPPPPRPAPPVMASRPASAPIPAPMQAAKVPSAPVAAPASKPVFGPFRPFVALFRALRGR